MKINHMEKGMWPMNYASRLVKEAADIMFSIGVCDLISVKVEIEGVRGLCDQLEKSIIATANTPDNGVESEL